MDIKSAQAQFGLSVAATPTSTSVSGTVSIGTSNTSLSLTGADVAYSLRAVLSSAASELILDATNGTTAGSTAWSAGTAQVETATAAGTIGTAGNASVTITATGMTGSPKLVSVAVAASDTAATWAGKVRAALAADTDVTALYAVGGTTTAITLTRLANSRGVIPANDATLNIALANDTCTGITPAASSANTTAGVASTGALIYDGDGKDFEGVTIPAIATLKGIAIKCAYGEVDYSATDESGTVKAGETRVFANNSGMTSLLDDITFTAVSESDITITAIGATV
jgi:phage tail sheath gpL-like